MKPELLAPAGNFECLKAAINAGCDAVYLGGKLFGARNYAGNFDKDEIVEAINYAHLYGVKVYVTVNTLIYDDEVDEFIDFVDYIHQNNVDAIIIQDLGMLDLVRKMFPKLEIHASTQMHIHNLEGVKFAEEMGIKRVVLARETSIDLIREIKNNSNIDLEIFIHGALCMCYSGQCLMSKFLTGRSGNRGTCSQPCRMKYDLYSNNKKMNKYQYLLSTKDLNTIERIGELIELGVSSLKIEGRMKRPEYVYLITSLYRKAIDNYIKYKKTLVTDDDINNMKKIFNREFTKGFLFNEDNDNFTNEFRPNHLGIQIGEVIEVGKKIKIKLLDELNQGDGIRIIGKNDDGGIINKLYVNNKLVNSSQKGIVEIDNIFKANVGSKVLKTSDKKQLEEINNLINKQKKILINAEIECFLNEPLKLILNDGINNVEVYGEKVEKSLKINTTEEDIKKQISRFGNTAYELNDIKIKKDDNIFIKNSDLNELRRHASTLLDKKRMYNTEYERGIYHIDLIEYIEEPGIAYETNKYIETAKYIYTTNKNLKAENVIYKLPRVIEKNIPEGNYLCSEIGSIYLNKSYSDFSLNVTNSYTVAFLNSIGVKRVTLSYELNLEQIKNLVLNYIKRYNQKPNLEMIVSSYPELMVTKYNILKKYDIKEGHLRDINGKIYELESDGKFIHIRNYEKIEYDINECYKIGINTLRIQVGDD